MIRRLLLALFMVAIATAAHAQAPKGNLPPHQATFTWTNGVDPSGTTITGSNPYRCAGTCTATSGTFAVLTPSPLSATTTSYVDSAVLANTTYSWCITNLVTTSTGSFETACSNIVTATIPKDVASSPTLNAPVTQ